MSNEINPIAAISEEMSQADHGQTETILDYEPYRIKLDEDITTPEYTLKYNGRGFAPKGDIVGLKAQAKSGKSMFCAIIAASVLGCDTFGLDTTDEAATVLYIDTEQAKANAANQARRINALMGWGNSNNKRFNLYSLREMEIEERRKTIATLIELLKPTICIIDGLVDILMDFNDVRESQEVINELMKLSSKNDCCMVAVLHVNKSKESHDMRGHAGTMLLQKAADVFEVEKSKGGQLYTVKQTDTRNRPLCDNDEAVMTFALDGDGVPMPTAAITDNQAMEKRGKLKNEMVKAFGNNQEMSYMEIAKAYTLTNGYEVSVAKNGKTNYPTAKKKIREAVANGFLSPTDNGKYVINNN